MSTAPTRYRRELAVAEEAARTAGALIRTHAGTLRADAVRSKGTHDLVTFVDEAAQQHIVELLQEAFPSDAILAEEGAEATPSPHTEGRCWIVDPLDGTTNFAHGVPPYAVSIALTEASEPVVGVVYDVPHDELFVAAQGGGLTCNGSQVNVSATEALEASLIATGFPFRDYRYVEGYLTAFERLMRETRGVRRHGAAAVDLAWVACGRFDGFFEAGLASWDVAAGAVLVREGGGCVSALAGGTDPVYGGGIVASNGRLHNVLKSATAPLGRAHAAARAASTAG